MPLRKPKKVKIPKMPIPPMRRANTTKELLRRKVGRKPSGVR